MNFIIKTIYKTSIAAHSFACLFNKMWVRLKAESTKIYYILFMIFFVYFLHLPTRRWNSRLQVFIVTISWGYGSSSTNNDDEKKCDYIIISVNKSKNKTKWQNKYWLGVSPSLSFVWRSFFEVLSIAYVIFVVIPR